MIATDSPPSAENKMAIKIQIMPLPRCHFELALLGSPREVEDAAEMASSAVERADEDDGLAELDTTVGRVITCTQVVEPIPIGAYPG